MATQRIAVVTGGNKGIGFAIVKELCAKFEGRVYLTARDEGRGATAVEELKKLGLSPHFHQLDIDNQDSINKFSEYIKNTYGGLDVLVNNAAIAYKRAATEPFGEQAENTIRVNYFGTLALCHALFPLLRPHARVCHVSSSCGHLSEICGDEPAATQLRAKLSADTLTENELADLMNQFVETAKDGTFRQKGWPGSTYVVSKVGVSALTRIQHRAFLSDSREDIVVNSCHPGYVDTDMTSHKGPMTIEQGAACPAYLALLPPNISEPRGAYLWHDKSVVDWTNKKPAPV
ncbi:carbonyl reductase [NADPH] 3-like [Portunus trituberculatus]|uniref:carbonyl reductase [NADPH] 3-like n=1 Tax=Portunus trituberculatus TaxID=210409 RepID=UPI001E1D0051|nr:carbonyl reductase [NADPH] 3-like [Portunus trituberculatus]XP_045131884.1 carbonyl reductase [NADPH] 3-like [Portunus trituberculatus]XP_045131890.1 carbonyl reductase [NADPH] 3-like [Portunus trituberculatus]XP_045131899.1 carbonyl reductase [NADPH] 3-like [Portunus trituberculatus]XP_045131908.1 carbonyl reductase [NADPH] 3-like [Portunus trituberculatus]XP_045131917.1 carbonyl reductase [NADPH] 3-like [Portunus trituberculatus]XP_045131927.1 carbonyl reductase [NADPH] 3-like [Portunus 